jgi:hypothetical protein
MHGRRVRNVQDVRGKLAQMFTHLACDRPFLIRLERATSCYGGAASRQPAPHGKRAATRSAIVEHREPTAPCRFKSVACITAGPVTCNYGEGAGEQLASASAKVPSTCSTLRWRVQPLGVARDPRPASGLGRDDILSEQEVEEAAEGGYEHSGASAGDT